MNQCCKRKNTKKLEKSAHRAYTALLKSFVFEAPMSEDIKHYLYIFLLHELFQKKKYRVCRETAIVSDKIVDVFVDIESEAIFCQHSGEYIGYMRNGKMVIVQSQLSQ